MLCINEKRGFTSFVQQKFNLSGWVLLLLLDSRPLDRRSITDSQSRNENRHRWEKRDRQELERKTCGLQRKSSLRQKEEKGKKDWVSPISKVLRSTAVVVHKRKEPISSQISLILFLFFSPTPRRLVLLLLCGDRSGIFSLGDCCISIHFGKENEAFFNHAVGTRTTRKFFWGKGREKSFSLPSKNEEEQFSKFK